MKNRLLHLAVIGLMLVAGCVPSLNTIYTSQDLVFDASLLGTWQQRDSTATWQLNPADGKSYELVYHGQEGSPTRFAAHLVNVEETLFLDLFPADLDPGIDGFFRIHYLPIHTIYLVKQTKPVVTLGVFDYGWFEQYMAEHPDALETVTFDGKQVIAAPTGKLQTFLREHPEGFSHEIELARLATS